MMISAIILAAGQATRFGQSKQLTPLRGKPLLQHVVESVNASRADDVIIVLGAYADEIRAQLHFGRARPVLNAAYAEGMSTSIRAGLRAMGEDTEAAMIVLGDEPFVRTRTVDDLIEEYERTRAAAVIPTHKGIRGNPVIVDRRLFPEMMNLRGDVGCRAIFADYAGSIVKLAVDDGGVLADIDRVDDLPRSESKE